VNKYKSYTYSMGPFSTEEEALSHLTDEIDSWVLGQTGDYDEVYRTVFKQTNGWRCEFKISQEIE
jgi:hypothetical protein